MPLIGYNIKALTIHWYTVPFATLHICYHHWVHKPPRSQWRSPLQLTFFLLLWRTPHLYKRYSTHFMSTPPVKETKHTMNGTTHSVRTPSVQTPPTTVSADLEQQQQITPPVEDNTCTWGVLTGNPLTESGIRSVLSRFINNWLFQIFWLDMLRQYLKKLART